ncbi:MAG: HEPN domain-containing protein, partial [Pedobacter sp.]
FNSRPHISVETDYTEGLNRSKEFLAGAELFMKRKQFAIATFMIHQSIEQSLRTFIRIGLCYSINTHNINKLIRYAIWVDHRLPAIVLRKTNEQKRLYSLLQQSYIESRYTRNFSIHERDVATLIVKATEIQDLLVKSGMEIIQATISSVTV